MWPTEVCSEEHPGSMHESDCRGGFLIGQSLGVGKAGEPVDGGVQVHVAGAGSGSLGAFDGLRLVRALAVGTPATALPVSARPSPASTCTISPGQRATIRLGSRLLSPVGSRNLRRFNPRRARCRLMVRTAIVVPSLLSSWAVRRADHFLSRRSFSIRATTEVGVAVGWLVVGHARAIQQSQFPELAEAGYPFAGAGAGDAHLGSDVGDGTGLATFDESAAMTGIIEVLRVSTDPGDAVIVTTRSTRPSSRTSRTQTGTSVWRRSPGRAVSTSTSSGTRSHECRRRSVGASSYSATRTTPRAPCTPGPNSNRSRV